MSLQAVLVWEVQSTVLLAALLIACNCLRKSPSLRVILCRAALLGTLALLIASPWLHERPRPVIAINMVPQRVESAVTKSEATQPTDTPLTHPSPRNSATSSTERVSPIEFVSAHLSSLWLLGVIIFGCFLPLGYWRLARLRRKCRPVTQGTLFEATQRASSILGLRTPEVQMGAHVSTPFVAGILRPTLYVPSEWVESEMPDRIDAILLHEMAHIAAKDLHWSLIYRVCAIVMWPQPLLWFVSRPMASASEELCDERVLSSGYSPEGYAMSLLNLRQTLVASRKRVPVGIGAVSVRSAFGRRIEAIMSYTERLGKAPKKITVGACVLACGVICSASGWLFAAPKLGISAPESTYTQVSEMSGHASIRIVAPKGNLAASWAAVLFDGPNLEQHLVETPIREGKVDVELAGHPGSNRATLIVSDPGYGLTYRIIWPIEKPFTEIRLGDPTRLSGTFLDPDGKPAAYLKVVPKFLSWSLNGGTPMEFLMAPREVQSRLAVETDSRGHFEMPNLPQGGQVDIDVDDDRFAQYATFENRTKLSTGPDSIFKTAHLRPGATLEGLVTSNGRPVEGVSVGAQSNNDGYRPILGYGGNAITDAKGHFHIRRLSPGHYNLIAATEYNPKLELTAVAHEDVVLGEGKTISNLDFALIPGAIVKGIVRRRDGSPAPGIPIGIYGPAHPKSSAWVQGTTTGPDGAYRLRVPGGKQYVYIMLGELDNGGQNINVPNGAETEVDFKLK